MNLVYLATPYSKYPGGRQKAYQEACKKAGELMKQGYAVFCPIAHSHSIETDGDFGEIEDGDWWLQQDFAILDWCDALVVYKMPGWEESYGVAKEIERADKLEIPINYIEYKYGKN